MDYGLWIMDYGLWKMDGIHCEHRQLNTSYLALAIGLLARLVGPLPKSFARRVGGSGRNSRTIWRKHI
jgi:hypothetical protein